MNPVHEPNNKRRLIKLIDVPFSYDFPAIFDSVANLVNLSDYELRYFSGIFIIERTRVNTVFICTSTTLMWDEIIRCSQRDGNNHFMFMGKDKIFIESPERTQAYLELQHKKEEKTTIQIKIPKDENLRNISTMISSLFNDSTYKFVSAMILKKEKVLIQCHHENIAKNLYIKLGNVPFLRFDLSSEKFSIDYFEFRRAIKRPYVGSKPNLKKCSTMPLTQINSTTAANASFVVTNPECSVTGPSKINSYTNESTKSTSIPISNHSNDDKHKSQETLIIDDDVTFTDEETTTAKSNQNASQQNLSSSQHEMRDRETSTSETATLSFVQHSDENCVDMRVIKLGTINFNNETIQQLSPGNWNVILMKKK